MIKELRSLYLKAKWALFICKDNGQPCVYLVSILPFFLFSDGQGKACFIHPWSCPPLICGLCDVSLFVIPTVQVPVRLLGLSRDDGLCKHLFPGMDCILIASEKQRHLALPYLWGLVWRIIGLFIIHVLFTSDLKNHQSHWSCDKQRDCVLERQPWSQIDIWL